MDIETKLFVFSSAMTLMGIFGLIFSICFWRDNVKKARAYRKEFIEFEKKFAKHNSLSENELESPMLVNLTVHFHYLVWGLCLFCFGSALIIGIEGLVVYLSL